MDGYSIRRACIARSDCYDGDQNSIDSCSAGECVRSCTATTTLAALGSPGGSACGDPVRHCPDGHVATGMHVRSDAGGVNRLELVCREVEGASALGSTEQLRAHGCGGDLGASRYLRCTDLWADGHVLGTIARVDETGDHLHSVGLRCGRLGDPGIVWEVFPPDDGANYTELSPEEWPAGEQAYGLNVQTSGVTHSLQLLCNPRMP